jgi:drug/metabolite transporter (DMT)-like permease
LVAILGGFGAALAWAVSTLCSSRASRIVDPASVVAWVSFTGLVVLAPWVIADGAPGGLDGGAAGWLALAGAGNVGGLLLAYVAYRRGAVALIAPLVATEGAIAALIAIAAGETVGATTIAALAVIAAGVSLAAMPRRSRSVSAAAHDPRVLATAGLAALAFGVSLYATGRVSLTLPLAWVVLPARLLGTVAVALTLFARGRLRLTRRAAPLVAGAGVCEVLGFSSYTLGARHGIAVSAVVGCQFAALAAVGGYVLFGERLGRVQVLGVLVLLAGVTLLSATQS